MTIIIWSVKWASIVALCSALALASDPAGPERCRSCHGAQYATQAKSHHALALRPIGDTDLPVLLASQPLRERSGISFDYEQSPAGTVVRTILGDRTASARLEWAFGAGAQAITPVGRIAGQYLEHRISWYTAEQGARRTLGHSGAPSPDPAAALGLIQKPETSFRCFNCHATGVKPGPDLRSMIPGVTCERCHNNASNHAMRNAPMRAAKRSRDGVMELCGSCHRLPSSNPEPSPEEREPLSIRFAPVGLMASACYRKSSELSCLTCHNPHEDLNRDETSYVAKCQGCHEHGKQCRAGERDGCLRCHMRQRSPAPYLIFTDHRIRIYRQ